MANENNRHLICWPVTDLKTGESCWTVIDVETGESFSFGIGAIVEGDKSTANAKLNAMRAEADKPTPPGWVALNSPTNFQTFAEVIARQARCPPKSSY